MEKIFSFHALLSRVSSNKHYQVSIFEHLFCLVPIFDLNQLIFTDLRVGKLQSSSSKATPFMTLTAGGISNSLKWMSAPGKTKPLHS